MKKRTLSLILSVAMVVTMVVAFVVPASAAAKIEPDAAWYQESATELVIEDAADFLAFMEKLAESNPTVNPDLVTVTGNSAFAGKTVKLAADIDLNPGWKVPADISNMEEKVEPPVNYIRGESDTQKAFAGVFDGQGHTVSGLYIDSSSASHGSIFGVAVSVESKAVEVKNVAFVNSYITSKNLGMASLFTGVEKASTLEISNVYVDVDLYSGNTGGVKTSVNVGGLVSTVGGTLNMSNSVYAGVIDAGLYVTDGGISHYGCGGMVFLVQGTVDLENCGFFGKINWPCGQRVAKIVGRIENNGTLTLTRCIAGGEQFNGDPAVNQNNFGSTNNATVLGNFVFTAANKGFTTTITANDVIYVPMNGQNYGGSDPVILSSPVANGTGNTYEINKTHLVEITAEELNGTSAVLKSEVAEKEYDLTAGWQTVADSAPMPTTLVTLFGADFFAPPAVQPDDPTDPGNTDPTDPGNEDPDEPLEDPEDTTTKKQDDPATEPGTTKPTDPTTGTTETEKPKKKGCGSTVSGVGGVLVAVLALGAATLRKKEH